MRALVTGAAGFIGSTLVDTLIAAGDEVVGVDCFTSYYGAADKQANLVAARDSPSFEFIELDLRIAELDELLGNIDVVFHQAAQPGVRLSWDSGFATYVSCNIVATQRLLEACRRVGVDRLVYASSSSVYGNAETYPVSEMSLLQPYSPYGVTKLAAEHLCVLYARNFGVPTVALRYFTVYGPRQRPDMATHRLIESALGGEEFPLFGDGSHVRDFTFVADIVSANRAAATADVPSGFVANVCGGSSTSMSELIDVVGTAVGQPVPVKRQPEQHGDVKRTGGESKRACETLGWEPAWSLADGVAAQVAWHIDRMNRSAP